MFIVARGNPWPSPLNDSPVINIFSLITNLGLRRKGASTHCLAMSTAWPMNTRVKLSGKFDSFSSILWVKRTFNSLLVSAYIFSQVIIMTKISGDRAKLIVLLITWEYSNLLSIPVAGDNCRRDAITVAGKISFDDVNLQVQNLVTNSVFKGYYH